MKATVIDTSALLRFYIPDGPLPDGLEATVESALRSEVTLLAPELALAEAAQVLLKKQQAGLLKTAEANDILAALLDLPIDFIGHRELLPTALPLAHQLAITVYDALFLSLAAMQHAALITADKSLERTWQRHRAG